jgi:hypothetical protein
MEGSNPRLKTCLTKPRDRKTTIWRILSMMISGTKSTRYMQFPKRTLTSRSCGVIRRSGSLSKQLSTNSSASFGKRPSGVNLGAGSLTICWSSSRMLIVIPPPCRLTPLLFLLSFFAIFGWRGGNSMTPPGLSLLGESVPSKSDRSESSDEDSQKGKRPRASSISEIPSDQTSDFTVY